MSVINSETYMDTSLWSLLEWIESNNFSGYDPYDGLNSKRLEALFNNKLNRLLCIQLLKYCPVNARELISIERSYNPKGVGIILKSYLKIYKFNGDNEYLDKAIELFEWLKSNRSEGYSGYCWGYNFPWQSFDKFLKKGDPTIVNTSFISNAILDLYDATQNDECLDTARSSCDFILKDLNITEKPEGVCFSYTPFDKNLCHNANLLGAELLSRVYSITGEETLLEYAKKAFDFTLYHQNSNGSWNYSINPSTGEGRTQIDFHQGFVLDSIFNYIRYIKQPNDTYTKTLLRGVEFYKNEQFFPDGRCKWRWPRVWPVDIHNQAQGIITFSKLAKINPEYLDFARTIAEWTISNMQDVRGYFYYQKWPFFTNKIPYMRWGQAWMMLALATLLENTKYE